MTMAHPAFGVADAERVFLCETPPVDLCDLDAEVPLHRTDKLTDDRYVASMTVDEHELLEAPFHQGDHEVLDDALPGLWSQIKCAWIFAQGIGFADL